MKEEILQKLIDYFTKGIEERNSRTVGAEIETQFVDKAGNPITTAMSQQILQFLVQHGWNINTTKGNLITTIVDPRGNKIFYELGRHNLEVATVASTAIGVCHIVRECLNQLYEAAATVGAEPHFAPILQGDEDLLLIPDKRDAIWLELDGRDALAPLARISSVQFTISIAPQEAGKILNAFGEQVGSFLADFPQDAIWKQYIEESAAGYLPDRYGGPLVFDNLSDYCLALVRHDVVQGARLVPYSKIKNNMDISLYLRSIWWHFRLKRYGNTLCLEVRPMARRTDNQLRYQLERVLTIVST